MRLLVLGGSEFVGRAVVEAAVERGWQVTTFNRGTHPVRHPEVEQLHGDRLAAGGLDTLRGQQWDAVVDTWSGAPRAVLESARALRGSVGHYGYVSSGSVYAQPVPTGADENAPVVSAPPDGGDGPYDEMKAGAEAAAVEVFGDHALLARAGLILGPYENIGRLPWWLSRAARGGPMLAPGPAELPLQFVDARDLAAWMLHAAEAGLGGPYNVVSRADHTTMRELLDACVAVTGGVAQLRWVDAATVLAAGIEPWNDLPIWIPPGHEYLDVLPPRDAGKVLAAGLVCRPAAETVADTWAWLEREGRQAPQRADRPRVGITREVEAVVLGSAPA